MMRLVIKKLAGGDDVLFGVPKGREILARMVAAAREFEAPGVVYLDFAGLVSATASFLREGPLEFRRVALGGSVALYPVVANASPAIIDDLELLLTARNDAMLVCDLKGKNAPANVRLIGKLESKQQLTYDLVVANREVDAGALARADRTRDDVGTTAWNNRLASLVAKGLIMESARGRSKVFKPVLQD